MNDMHDAYDMYNEFCISWMIGDGDDLSSNVSV